MSYKGCRRVIVRGSFPHCVFPLQVPRLSYS